MFLYTTVIYIKNRPVRYEVSMQEKNKILLYKPELPLRNIAELPVLWVIKQNGEWMLMNIKDPSLYFQVLNDIKAHEQLIAL